ncbi:MAG: baseplate J/gp47 family protein, partial [Evtepia sp.]
AQQALAVEGVAAVNVVPKARGLGTVDLYVTDAGGVPEQALLDAVKTDLAPKREIGVSLQVLAPETVTVNVLVTVKAKAGFSASQVLEAVRAALAAWFDGTMLGKDLLLAQIGQRIYQVEGVENYHIASPANDVTVERGQLPVLGTLAVEELV